MNRLDENCGQKAICRVTSSDEQCGACTTPDVHASRIPENLCADTLHALNNAISSILLNAQVMEWKLPPYSHAKRHAREIERNAQRSVELMKQLTRRLSGRDAVQEQTYVATELSGRVVAVTAQEPNSSDAGLVLPMHIAGACGS